MIKNAHAYHYEGEPGNDTALLAIHGFTGTPQTLHPLIEAFHDRGYAVDAPMLTGHGTRVEDMDALKSAHWIDDVVRAAQALKRTHKRVVAAGLSMGGCLALILAARGLVDGVISINAPIRIRNNRAALAWLVWPVHRYEHWTPIPKPDGFLADYDEGYTTTPVRCVPHLRRIMREAHRRLTGIQCPALVVQTRADETVLPVSGQLIYDGIPHSNKTLLWLERSSHVSTLDVERGRIHEAALEFVGGLARAWDGDAGGAAPSAYN